MNRPNKYVAYYRVSTRRQGASGLGLEAQKKDVASLAVQTEGPITAEYVEVETGKTATRPKLAEAIRHAKLTNSTLVVAKLDRLARNAHFTRCLRESGVPFLCCDNPNANELTIDILAVIAEHEAKAIASRTKAALAVARERGTLLGSSRPGHWDGHEDRRQAGGAKGRPMGTAENARRAAEYYGDVIVPKAQAWHVMGKTCQEIADLLNADGFTTRRRKPFTAMAVWRLLDRYVDKSVPATC